MPCSSGIGNTPSQNCSTTPADYRGSRHQAAQPGSPHQRLREPGCNLEVLGICLQGVDRHRGDRPPKRRQSLVTAFGLGLPLGVAAPRRGRREGEVDRVRGVVLPSTPVGCSPSRGARIASKSAVSSSGIIVKPPAGLIGYDTSHAIALQRQTRWQCDYGHAGGHPRGAWFRWRAGPTGANPITTRHCSRGAQGRAMDCPCRSE